MAEASKKRERQIEEAQRKNEEEPTHYACNSQFLRRMYDVSAFMKTLKQNAIMSYNCGSVHTGTMWESRFRVREYMPDENCADECCGLHRPQSPAE